MIGYRAPSWSITAQSLWAFDVLAEEGFVYDASIFPIRHDLYGYACRKAGLSKCVGKFSNMRPRVEAAFFRS